MLYSTGPRINRFASIAVSGICWTNSGSPVVEPLATDLEIKGLNPAWHQGSML
jgi:hypothetical protein